MKNWQSTILIGIIALLALSVSHGFAQNNPQLWLTLVGERTERYLAPAGATTTLKLQILNVAPHEVYLLQGEAYLDPDLSGAWQLIHSEQMGDFHLNYLQSAIWTFELAVPARIQAANVTNGTPQVNLLIKIVYRPAGEPQGEEQSVFTLDAPGAIVQQQYNMIWYALAGTLIVFSIAATYLVTKRKRVRYRRGL